MLRSTLALFVGVFLACLITSLISVYLFHDVDLGKGASEALISISGEVLIFAILLGLVGGGIAAIGRRFFFKESTPLRLQKAFYVGFLVGIGQYAWDLTARTVFPGFGDLFLTLYIILALIVCTYFLLRGSESD
jgi:hypothetical protein